MFSGMRRAEALVFLRELSWLRASPALNTVFSPLSCSGAGAGGGGAGGLTAAGAGGNGFIGGGDGGLGGVKHIVSSLVSVSTTQRLTADLTET